MCDHKKAYKLLRYCTDELSAFDQVLCFDGIIEFQECGAAHADDHMHCCALLCIVVH